MKRRLSNVGVSGAFMKKVHPRLLSVLNLSIASHSDTPASRLVCR
jgi:hypothetical protein